MIIERKNLKPKKSISEYDLQRETKVLLEAIRSEVKIVAEGHSLINNKLDKIDSEFSMIKSEFVIVKSELTVVKSELNLVKMAVIDVDHQVKIIKSKQEETTKRLDTVILDHENRLCKLEAAK